MYKESICQTQIFDPELTRELIIIIKKRGKIKYMVNLENDVIGKYVEKLLGFKEESPSEIKSGIDAKFLMENGFM